MLPRLTPQFPIRSVRVILTARIVSICLVYFFVLIWSETQFLFLNLHHLLSLLLVLSEFAKQCSDVSYCP